MLNIVSTTAILFGAIFLGIFYSFIKVFQTDDSKILIKYVFNIALPCSLFIACLHAKLDTFNLKYIFCYSLAVILTSFLFVFLSKFYLKKPLSTAFLNTLSVTQVDGAYFAIPLFMLMFNDISHVISIQIIQNVFFFPLVIVLIDYYYQPKKNGDWTQKSKTMILTPLRILVTNPFIIASIFGLILGHCQFVLNHNTHDFLDLFGRSASAVALFSIGVSFYGHFKKLKNVQILQSFSLLTFGKLLVFPLVTFLIAKAAHLPRELLLPLILVTASPSATHCYVVANRYNLDEDVQTNTIILTTLLSFITISVLIYIFG